MPVDPLTILNYSEDVFTLGTATIGALQPGETGTFTVVPRTGLSANSYTGTVYISDGDIFGGDDIYVWNQLRLSFTVIHIELDSEGIRFGEGELPGYSAIPPHTVTIFITGNMPTGQLTVTLTGTGAGGFELNGGAASITVEDIPGHENATFTVGPKTGLEIGTYTATVTVSGGSGITASLDLSFQVIEPYSGIELDSTGTLAFPGGLPGYSAIPPRTVTIFNTGNMPTGQLTVTLTGTGAGGFELNG
jgi:hypothetical protein